MRNSELQAACVGERNRGSAVDEVCFLPNSIVGVPVLECRFWTLNSVCLGLVFKGDGL